MNDPTPRRDRLAIVTGATGAIGSAISRRLVADGARVALFARNDRRLERLEQAIGAPERVLRSRGDVTQAFDLVEARDAVRDRFGADPDLVVVSAGTFRASSFEAAVPSEWDAMIGTNIQGVLHTVQTFSEGVHAAAEEGRAADIVLIGSAIAEKRTTAFAVYSAISAAVEQLAKHLRDEFGARGVRVHHIAPYYVTSQLGADMSDAEWFREVQSQFVEYESIAPESVADLASFMVSLPARANFAEATIRPLKS
ncbi:SDR family oxidoreductase [Microbacterium sp. NPDC056569]|uniref:SDR family oxidoreductase n=1 Tax=Microbacterium sp. NPDC056569 TaxID=3345867 RepID=UPI00366FCC40